jgi:hypothetical protein
VLAVVADATGRYLRSRTARTDGLWLRAMVPVSTRSASDAHHLGNRVVSVFVDLPMFEMDPIERLHVCHEAMREVKSSHAAVGAGFLIGLGEFAPPTIHAMASRVAVNSRVFNFLVTNVPGPQMPVYCMGARLLGAFPFTPLAATHAYGVGVTSLDGWMNFGFTADYDACPTSTCSRASWSRPSRSSTPAPTPSPNVVGRSRGRRGRSRRTRWTAEPARPAGPGPRRRGRAAQGPRGVSGWRRATGCRAAAARVRAADRARAPPRLDVGHRRRERGRGRLAQLVTELLGVESPSCSSSRSL